MIKDESDPVLLRPEWMEGHVRDLDDEVDQKLEDLKYLYEDDCKVEEEE